MIKSFNFNKIYQHGSSLALLERVADLRGTLL